MTGEAETSRSQPDLRQVIADSVNQLMSSDDLPVEHRLKSPARPEQITIRSQRTWHDVTTINTRLAGGSFSACIAQLEDGDDLYSFFIEAVLPPDETEWRWAGSSGGKQPLELRDRAGGLMIAGRSHICVGGIGHVPDGGKLRVEMADGSVHEETAVDGCCVAFAPVTAQPSPDDHVTIRWFDADATELGSDRHWVGDGGPPPGVRPARS
ncbi:MAG: hypothetical protein ACRD1H_20840 [Vicinamibacterales bacterium]